MKLMKNSNNMFKMAKLKEKLSNSILQPSAVHSNSLENYDKKSLYLDHVVKEEIVIGPEVIQNHVKVEMPTREPINCLHHRINEAILEPQCDRDPLIKQEIDVETNKHFLESPICSINLFDQKLNNVQKIFVKVETPYEDDVKTEIHEGYQQTNSNEDNRHQSAHQSEVICKKEKAEYNCSCKICKEKFIESSELNTHVHKYKDEKRFTCDYCSKTFVSKYNLKNHILNHSGDRSFKCTECNKSFATSNYLINHKRTHTHRRPRNFGCPLCKKKFYTQSKLKTHENAHKGVKPFTCDLCEKMFYSNVYLMAHKKVHERYLCRINESGQTRRFACTVCPKRFRSSYHLRRHLANVHALDASSSEDQQITREAEINSDDYVDDLR